MSPVEDTRIRVRPWWVKIVLITNNVEFNKKFKQIYILFMKKIAFDVYIVEIEYSQYV